MKFVVDVSESILIIHGKIFLKFCSFDVVNTLMNRQKQSSMCNNKQFYHRWC